MAVTGPSPNTNDTPRVVALVVGILLVVFGVLWLAYVLLAVSSLSGMMGTSSLSGMMGTSSLSGMMGASSLSGMMGSAAGPTIILAVLMIAGGAALIVVGRH